MDTLLWHNPCDFLAWDSLTSPSRTGFGAMIVQCTNRERAGQNGKAIMRTFPIFIDLAESRVVVIGGGEQATQKVRLLLKTPAKIEVVHETLNDELAELVASGRISVQRRFHPALIDNCRIV